ncbi:MAG TPA: STAS domain-containing protein [Streptosporangiaceae bacterium]|jgi:anti-anti-sigma factor|nr:STAS domain-containing protein [Streptosporangiaceae bacterium]
MTTPLTLSTDQRPDGTAVLTAVGEIDMSNASQLRDALDRAGGGPLVIDLTSCEYLDSAGLTVLFTHADHIELVAAPLLVPVLNISGLSQLTSVHQAGPEADAAAQ